MRYSNCILYKAILVFIACIMLSCTGNQWVIRKSIRHQRIDCPYWMIVQSYFEDYHAYPSNVSDLYNFVLDLESYDGMEIYYDCGVKLGRDVPHQPLRDVLLTGCVNIVSSQNKFYLYDSKNKAGFVMHGTVIDRINERKRGESAPSGLTYRYSPVFLNSSGRVILDLMDFELNGTFQTGIAEISKSFRNSLWVKTDGSCTIPFNVHMKYSKANGVEIIEVPNFTEIYLRDDSSRVFSEIDEDNFRAEDFCWEYLAALDSFSRHFIDMTPQVNEIRFVRCLCL